MSAELDAAKASFQEHAKTFSLAARLLPGQQYADVARLYAFCRYVDDLADAEPSGINDATLRDIRRALLTGDSPNARIEDTQKLIQQHQIPIALFIDFMDELIADQWPRELTSVDQVVQFAYGVASTVGLMMCHILGVKDPKAFPFAVDLGVAMQMTNICRDILEDAERDRIYVPRDLIAAPVDCAGLLAGNNEQRSAAYNGASQLLAIADDYYASAEHGYYFLPFIIRQTIAFAALLYRSIGTKMLNHPNQYWQRRTVVGTPTKMRIIGGYCISRLITLPVAGASSPATHQSHLHHALDSRRFQA